LRQRGQKIGQYEARQKGGGDGPTRVAASGSVTLAGRQCEGLVEAGDATVLGRLSGADRLPAGFFGDSEKFRALESLALT
jgi:hypothetical protein